jgi:DNA-binding protein HU-beta
MAAKTSAPVAKAASVKTAKGETVKPRAARGAATQATITLKQIGVEIAQSHEAPKRQVDALLDDVIAAVVKHLKKGAKVRLSGLGILQVKKRAARKGRNPATGEPIKIKASKKVAFRVARDLKAAL